jgi:hypothetical protein
MMDRYYHLSIVTVGGHCRARSIRSRCSGVERSMKLRSVLGLMHRMHARRVGER